MPRNKLSDLEAIIRYNLAQNIKSEMHGITQAELSRKSGIPVTTISGYLRAKSTPNDENVRKIARALNVSPAKIDPRLNLEKDKMNTLADGLKSIQNIHYAESNNVKYVPLVGTIALGTPITADENIERYIPEYFINDIPEGTLFDLKCKGHSMEPTVPDGAIALIREQPQVEDDEIAAVLIDGEATLKRVKHSNGRIILVPDNRSYAPIILDEDHPGKIIGKLLRYTYNFE